MHKRSYLLGSVLALFLTACGGGDDGGTPVVSSSSTNGVSSTASSINVSSASISSVANECANYTLDETHCFLDYVMQSSQHQKCCDTWIADQKK